MKIVTFSGIDGAGKSTQIASLKVCLGNEAIQIASLTFGDDTAVLSCFPELTLMHVSYLAQTGRCPSVILHLTESVD